MIRLVNTRGYSHENCCKRKHFGSTRNSMYRGKIVSEVLKIYLQVITMYKELQCVSLYLYLIQFLHKLIACSKIIQGLHG